MVNENDYFVLFYKDGKMNDQSYTFGKIISGINVRMDWIEMSDRKRKQMRKGYKNNSQFLISI